MTVTYSQTSVYHNLYGSLTPIRYDNDSFLTNVDRECFIVRAKHQMSFSFIKLVDTQKILTSEILLHEVILCYVHVCNDQHGCIQNGTLWIRSGNPSLL